VTKGPGIALEGATVADRAYIDLDVLVEPVHFNAARCALSSVGYKEEIRSVQPWRSFDQYCREAINLRTEGGGSIDLHHRVAPWYWSTGLSRNLLRAAVRPTDVFGLQLPLVSAEHNLLVAALHSDKNHTGQTYRAWRDLLVLARRCCVDSVVKQLAKRDYTNGWRGSLAAYRQRFCRSN
jgi:hypothetical protein